MARKLTEQERENIETLRAALTEALPPAQRGIASGIASALVRKAADLISEEDLSHILGKYDEADETAAQVVKDTLLDAVEGQEGVYTVRVPEGAADDAAGQSEQEPEESPAAEPEDPEADEADVAPEPVPAEEPAVETPKEPTEPTEPVEPEPAPPEQPEQVPAAAKPKRSRRSRRTHKSARAAQDAKDPAKEKAEETPEAPKEDAAKQRQAPAPSRDLKKVPYVRRGGESDAEVRQKIVSLDQRFWMNGWLLSHPGAYTLYERELLAINDALKDGMLPGDITRRQLAYQMGGDEKFFEYGNDGFRLLRAMGMEDVIRHRPMPKPDLVYYAPRRRKHMRVLVTENLDPYLDVHDLMYEDGRTSILGQRIHAVVLGGGTPILERNRLALLLDTLGADTVTVLYWGDIDRAGLEIMVKLKDVLGDKYKFRAFTPAYQLMVDKAMERFPDPADNESTGQVNIDPMDSSLLTKGLTDEAAAYARAVIEDCGLIPQEILTRRDL